MNFTIKAIDLPVGAKIKGEDIPLIERATYEMYRRAWGRECPAGKVPFFAPLPGGRLEWFLVPLDVELGEPATITSMGEGGLTV